jgi:hypothetical protein
MMRLRTYVKRMLMELKSAASLRCPNNSANQRNCADVGFVPWLRWYALGLASVLSDSMPQQ